MKKLNLFVLCSLVAVVGCGKKAEEKIIEKAIEKEIGGKADVDLSNESINIKTKEGEVSMASGTGAKIPDDFPSDVYLFKGATVAMALQVPEGHSVSLNTKTPAEKVAEAYAKEMTKKGWSQEASMDMGPQKMLAYKKNERMVNVVIGIQDGSTIIGLTVIKEK